MIPIENTLAGTVAEHADLMLTRDVFIQAEYLLRIVHNVIAMPGVKLRSLRRVLSHPVALDQCRDFFSRNPKIEAVPFYDTAGSVKHVIANQLKDAAGIAGLHAAREYSGSVVKSSVEDDKSNFTRFFLIRKVNRPSGSRNKKSGKGWLSSPDSSRREQDFDRFSGEERSGRAFQVTERLRVARH